MRKIDKVMKLLCKHVGVLFLVDCFSYHTQGWDDFLKNNIFVVLFVLLLLLYVFNVLLRDLHLSKMVHRNVSVLLFRHFLLSFDYVMYVAWINFTPKYQ